MREIDARDCQHGLADTQQAEIERFADRKMAMPQLNLYIVTLPWNGNDSEEGDYCDKTWAENEGQAMVQIAEAMADTRDEQFNSAAEREQFIDNLLSGAGTYCCELAADRIKGDIESLLKGPSGDLTAQAKADLARLSALLAPYVHESKPAIKESYTVWQFDYDAAPHHNNDLKADTFDDVDRAAEVARQRVAETNHNTGWAKVVDNNQKGRMGDSGLIVEFKKDKNGRVFESGVRAGYEGRFTKSAAPRAPRSR